MNRRIEKILQKAARRLQPLCYWRPGGYDAARYWSHRLKRYGFDPRGVGNAARTAEENARDYRSAGDVFLALCRSERVDLLRARMLDIGCGTGYYARLFRESGGKQYLGVDITDVLFGELRRLFPLYRFLKLDVSKKELPGEFDLILMIDVTQHLTAPRRFSRAMRNVRAHLSPEGVFIVTSWLEERARRSFYEASRALPAYSAEFPGYHLSPPLPFRDKWIFSIRK